MTSLRNADTLEEAIGRATAWMVDSYGRPLDLPEEARDRWHERMGLLVDCLTEMFPEEEAPADERK